MNKLGISTFILCFFLYGMFIQRFINNSKKENDRRFFINSDFDNIIKPTESKVVSEKSISIRDVIKGKNTRFYLDGKQI